MEPRHSLFRERALQEYIQTQEKNVRPQFVPSFVPVLFYILLLMLILVGVPVWWGEIPVFTNGPGIVMPEKASQTSHGNSTVITLFLPASSASQVQVGTTTQVSADSADQQFTGTIKQVHSEVLSANEARQRYELNDALAQVLPRSSVAVTIVPTAKSAPRLHMGDLVNARVQTGSQRVLSLLLSFH